MSHSLKPASGPPSALRHRLAGVQRRPLAQIENLTPYQRAMVAARIANMRQGERTDLQPSANLPKVKEKVSRAEAGGRSAKRRGQIKTK